MPTLPRLVVLERLNDILPADEYAETKNVSTHLLQNLYEYQLNQEFQESILSKRLNLLFNSPMLTHTILEISNINKEKRLKIQTSSNHYAYEFNISEKNTIDSSFELSIPTSSYIIRRHRNYERFKPEDILAIDDMVTNLTWYIYIGAYVNQQLNKMTPIIITESNYNLFSIPMRHLRALIPYATLDILN